LTNFTFSDPVFALGRNRIFFIAQERLIYPILCIKHFIHGNKEEYCIKQNESGIILK